MADADISDESGEIVFKTEDASVVDENVSPLISTAADLDAIMKVLQSIPEQNQGIENRLEQQGLKTELH